MTREIVVEYARKGVRCNALCPGPIDTPLLAELLSDPERRQRRFVHIPMGRLGRAEELANAALFLASDDSSYMTGTSLVVDGGIRPRTSHRRTYVAVLDAYLAVGGPNLVSGEGMGPHAPGPRDRRPGVDALDPDPLRAPAVISAIALGLMVDPVMDAFGISLFTTLSFLTLVFWVFAVLRAAATDHRYCRFDNNPGVSRYRPSRTAT